MAITTEMIKEFANEPAVFGCRVAAGTEIEPKHIEHPMFLSDMVNSNLFTVDEALTIGQVIGVKTAKDCDALTAVTEEAVGGAVKLIKKDAAAAADKETEPEDVLAADSGVKEIEMVSSAQDGNTIIISIKEGRDIYLELPL